MTTRAWSTLEIKSTDTVGGKRLFKGIASTPSVDSHLDIVEPKGAEFTLPIPLLWQHDSLDPIGWITSAKVTDKGIEVEGEVADIAEEGDLKKRLTRAWQMLRSRLVRGLSIGFMPLESEPIKGSFGRRFLRWAWKELSAVTVPSNMDCSVTAIKSADQAYLRASLGARPVVRLDMGSKPTPGASGKQSAKRLVYLNPEGNPNDHSRGANRRI
jgi:HK97 family phage prohead protease